MPPMKVDRSAPLFLWMLLAALVVYTHAGCGPNAGSEKAVSNRDIKAVMDAHVDELMAIPGVTGVAVGALDDGTPCILVLILEDRQEIRGKIPETIEGHPVRIIVSGEIKPLRDS